MAFLVASASSSITSGISIVSYFSVCISSSAMIDNVVYERNVPECVKIGYLQQQKYKKISQSPPFAPHPIQKFLGTPLLCPCTQNEKSAPLHLCVVSLCEYTVGFIL